MPLSDEDLLKRVATDAAAYEEFYRRNVDRITGFAARRCRTPHDVGDVVSATFLAVPGAAANFDPARGTARSWLYGIALHEVSAIKRRAATDHRLTQRLGGRRPLDHDEILELESQIEAARLAPRLSRALASAPPAERELFLLMLTDDLTPSEAARALGISPVAARVRLTRIRRRLRDSLPDPPPAETQRHVIPVTPTKETR